MRMHQGILPVTAALGLLLSASGCGGDGGRPATFELTIRPVPPPSQADLFDDIELLLVRLTDADGAVEEYELEVERGAAPAIEELGALSEGVTIELEGYAGTGDAAPLVAIGRSGPLDVGRAETTSIDIFMAAVGEMATFYELPSGAWGAGLASDGNGRFFTMGGTPDGWTDTSLDAIQAWDLVPPNADFAPADVTGFPVAGDAWAGYTNDMTGRAHQSVTLLAEGSHGDVGKILVAGGWEFLQASRTVTSQIFLFDPHAEPDQAIELLDGLKTGRAQHKAVALPSGDVVFFGGYNHHDNAQAIECPSTVEVYSAADRESDYGSQMTEHCMVDGAAAAAGDVALHCGGVDWVNNDEHALFGDCVEVDRFGNVTSVAGPSALGGSGWLLPAMASLEGDAVLISGGVIAGGTLDDDDWFDASNRAFIYDEASGSWTETKRMRVGRAGHIAAPLPDGRVLVAGGAARISNRGFDVEDELPCAEIYDPTIDEWTLLDGPCQSGSDVGSLPTGLFRPSVAVDPYYGVLIWSGLQESMSGQPKAQPSYALYVPEPE
jgi:hypothetical protein